MLRIPIVFMLLLQTIDQLVPKGGGYRDGNGDNEMIFVVQQTGSII